LALAKSLSHLALARDAHAMLIWSTSTSYDQERDFLNFQIEYYRITTLEKIGFGARCLTKHLNLTPEWMPLLG
jgi:hypothetical protein